ncbi:MAG: DUF1874 domain-containing protein [Methanobacteriota archaeon]
MRFILNSAVITAPGTYEYKLIRPETARNWFPLSGGYESCIGYPETAAALEQITGVTIPVSRKIITMQPADEALVFRLVFPQGYRPDPAQKGAMGQEFILKNCEIGILKRLK